MTFLHTCLRTQVHVSYVYVYACICLHGSLGVNNFFIKILLPNRSLCSCYHYRLPKRSLKSIWSIREITVGFYPLPNVYRPCTLGQRAVRLRIFLYVFCLKMALYCCPTSAHTTRGWHLAGTFSHRKPSWTWSKGFVLPSETPAEVCGSAGVIPAAGPEPASTLLQLFVYLQTSWLGGTFKITMLLLCDGHGDLCPLQMRL